MENDIPDVDKDCQQHKVAANDADHVFAAEALAMNEWMYHGEDRNHGTNDLEIRPRGADEYTV